MKFVGNRYELLNCEESLELNKIYKARDAYDNRKVLIKVIEHTPNISKDFMSNLIDESTAIDEINSPYISKILDVGIHCTEEVVLYYIVSEYCDGIVLSDIISGNYIHLEAIITMATQILKALEQSHSHGLYHGSLKPGNILVDEFYNVKIFDFGVTKANKGVNLRSYGDLRYLCPHQLNINYTDKESDFFTLGVILFESIFKRLPFGQATTDLEMLKLIDKGVNWNEIRAINGNEELINLIKKLMSRTKKYSSTQEILIDLSKIMYVKADIQEHEENSGDEYDEEIEYDDNEKSCIKEEKLMGQKVVLGSVAVLIALLMVLTCI